MRRTALLVATVLVLAVPASGQQHWRATPGGYVSGPVEYVDTLPVSDVTAGGLKLHRQHLYVTTWRSFEIYDVTDPVDPQLLSTTPLGAHFFNEQPYTNGKILILANDAPILVGQPRELLVWDVEDKSAPRRIGRYLDPKANDMWSACSTATATTSTAERGRSSTCPTPPRPCRSGTGHRSRRCQGACTPSEEVAPGLVMTGTVPAYLLDARQDPANPRVLAKFTPRTTNPSRPYLIIGIIGPARTSLPALVDWPLEATRRWALMSMETPFSGACNDQSGGFITYDTSDYQRRGTFTAVDEYTITTNGSPAEGKAAANVVECGAYAFDTPEDFADSGLVAVGWFEHGVRLLQVDAAGQIAEVGGFVPHGGNSAATLWRNDEIVYVADLYRGVDILRIPRPE
jgi:hypothetical protein